MECMLIVNPYSGKMKIQSELWKVIKLLNEAGFAVQVEITNYHNHARELARMAIDKNLVICSGGDGTLNQVVSGLMDRDLHIPLGYIPAGSTNDYANTLGLSFDIETATKNIINGTKYLLDVGKLNQGTFFNYVASFGLFTAVSYNTSQIQKNIFGKAAYFLNGLPDLTNVKTYHLVGKTPSGYFEGDYILGMVLNTTSVGGVMKINPEIVDLSDGLFEILLVKKPKDIIDRGNLVEGLINRDYTNPAFTFVRSNEIDFILDTECSWSLDGEEVKLGKNVHIENIKQRLPIIL